MPSTLVLNADLDVCPALGTWIVNNTQLLSGFSLLIGDDVLQELARRHGVRPREHHAPGAARDRSPLASFEQRGVAGAQDITSDRPLVHR